MVVPPPDDRRTSRKRLARPALTYVPLNRHRWMASIGVPQGGACPLQARVRRLAVGPYWGYTAV
jgi:hypothetical protein